MKIYVVKGSAGAYSDAHEWLVCAYDSEAEANKHAEAALNEAHRLHKKHGYVIYSERDKYPNRYDPGSDWVDSYISYEVDEIELNDRFVL